MKGYGAGLDTDAAGDLSTVRTQWARPNLDEIERVDQRGQCGGRLQHCSDHWYSRRRGLGHPRPAVEYSLVAIVSVRASTCRRQGK
jgi:hypothetical protein